MKTPLLIIAAFVPATLSFAQEPQAPARIPQQPEAAAPTPAQDPAREADAALALLEGHWRSTWKSPAMPGVAGMEKAQDWSGTERATRICDGAWLKVDVDMRSETQSMQGLWLVGYDEAQKRFAGIWADNHDEALHDSTGRFDAATRSFTFEGQCPMGRYRSVVDCKDPEHVTETCFLLRDDGREEVCLRVERHRVKGALPIDASAAMDRAPAAPLKPLQAQLGAWHAKLTVPDQTMKITDAEERITAICGDRWFWTDVTAQVDGKPFEGHALTGFDAAAGNYVRYWIDSRLPNAVRMTGEFDAANDTFSFAGKAMLDGKTVNLRTTCRGTAAETRKRTLEIGDGDAARRIELHYQRIAR